MGRKDIEDSLERLDKLAQEEARMASAELLKMTHSVDGKVLEVDDRVKSVEGNVRRDVQDVGDKVQNVDDRVQGIGKDISIRVQGVDDKLDQANRSFSLKPFVSFPTAQTPITGNQLRDDLLRWLSPPDVSTNHNIARKAHHNGTAEWFFGGNIFSQWKSTGSLLWIHGKRASPPAFIHKLIVSYSYSRVGEKCPLVCPSLTHSTLGEQTLSIQFFSHRRYHSPARCGEGIDGLFLS